MRIVIAMTLFAPVLAAQRTWTVDAANGPGADFTTIQPAIAAASAWDRIEVRRGRYPAFTLSKPVALVGAGGSSVQIPARVSVSNVASGIVELAGMSVFGLDASNLAVPFLVRDVVTGSAIGSGAASSATFARCAAVYATDCRFLGSPDGARVSDSGMVMVRCEVQGGLISGTGSGGIGMVSTRSRIVAAATTFRGGAGLQGGLGCSGFPHGPGGDGLVESGGSVRAIDRSTIAGGLGGSAFSGRCAPDGRAFVGNVAATPDCLVVGSPRPMLPIPRLKLPAAASASTSITATFVHAPNSTFWLFVDWSPGVFESPLFDVPLLLGPGLQFVVSVQAPTGTAMHHMTVPSTPALLIGHTMFFQLAAISPTTPDLRLSNPAAVLIR